MSTLKMISPRRENKTVFKFIIDPTIAATVKDVLLDRGWVEVAKEGVGADWSVYWCEVTGVREALDACRHGTRQKIPHFRNNYELTTKNMLYRNMKRHRRALLQSGKPKEAELCDCVPIIFELPAEYMMFVEEYRKSPGSTWIVKPARGSRGRGIFLFNKLKDLAEWREQQSKMDDQERFWLIQRYVEKPYLIGSRKFDLRIYVLVTSYAPLRVWMARDGFARICGSPYSLERLQDTLAHLTNSALQFQTPVDPKDPSARGCKWSLLKLRQFLSARHGALVVSAVFNQVASQVLTTLSAVQPVIMRSPHSFELYGYDVLFDEELTPWLLEVNASPTLTPTSLEDYQLKYNLVEDVFHILDYENKLTGQEIRVGGFDLIWNDGPVYKPALQDFCPADDKELNSFLGCYNDRDENLKMLHILRKYVPRCMHELGEVTESK